MELSIIIINWNSTEYLRECLTSIYEQTRDIDFEIFVLDNGSFDGCDKMLASHFPDVKFYQSEENTGFAHANNAAARNAGGKVLLFLNPDTVLVGPALNEMYNTFISIEDIGAAGAKLLNSDGSFQTSCLQPFPSFTKILFDADILRRLFPNALFGGLESVAAASFTPVPAEGISGACLMTYRKVFQKAGGFSEDYFMYYEDMDYCYTVTKYGLKNYFIPNAVITHHGGKSSGGTYSFFSNVTMAESGMIYFRKWRGDSYGRIFRFGLTIKSAASILVLLAIRLLTPSGQQFGRQSEALNKWKFIFNWCIKAAS